MVDREFFIDGVRVDEHRAYIHFKKDDEGWDWLSFPFDPRAVCPCLICRLRRKLRRG